MKNGRWEACASITVLSLMLAACGGGGGGGPVSTPPPAPAPAPAPGPSPSPTPTPVPAPSPSPSPTPSPGPSPSPSPTPSPTPTPTPVGANDDLLAPLASESFLNDAAFGSLHAPLVGEVTNDSGAVSLTISYNASTQTYSLTDGARSQTFTSANIDPSQSDALQTTYVKTLGTTTDALSLIKNGTGAGQTRYVGAGFWQRTEEGATAVDGRFTAFTYGVQTPDPAMPVNGAASFDVTLLGARSWSTKVWALGGNGVLNIDFSNGGMQGFGSLSEVDLDTGIVSTGYGWRTFAMLKSGTNNFLGAMYLDTFYGEAQLKGSFYGPAAQEVGAVWWGDSPDFSATSGALIGKRGTYPINQITSVRIPQNDSFFTPISGSVSAAMNGSGVLSNPVVDDAIKAVWLAKDASQTYFYRSPEETTQASAALNSTYEIFPVGLEYLRAGQKLDKANGRALLDSFVFGLDTSSANMPVTGHGYYDVYLRGGVLEAGEQLQTAIGWGGLVADFATGGITTRGDFETYVWDPASGLGYGTPISPKTDSGTWNGTASIASANKFAGTFQLDGATDFTGTMKGAFYGPTAEEVGVVLSLSAGSSLFSGHLSGARDDAVATGFVALADIDEQTRLTTVNNYLQIGQNYEGIDSEFDVYFDPTSSSARLTIADGPADYPYELARVGDAEFSEAESSDAANVYFYSNNHYGNHGPEERDYRLDEYIFDGQGGRIKLTYSGFSTILAKEVEGGWETRYFFVYGSGTPSDVGPRSGSASYTGIAKGVGAVFDYGLGLEDRYDLSGTTTMAVNFGTKTFTSSLDLQGTNLVDASAFDFGAYAFSGDLMSAIYDSSPTDQLLFYGAENGAGFDGAYKGLFFGPNAEEFGGSFDFTINGANGIGAGIARGGFVGAKD
jgi:hypothetical protein